MTKFALIDALILKRLAQGSLRFISIAYNREISMEAEKLAIPDRIGKTQGFRVVDRRLQALRKAGAIKFNSKTGWSLAEGDKQL